MKNTMLSNKGFSLVEGIVSAGIIALSVLAISAIVGQHSGMMKASEAKQELPGVGTDVVNRARAVLLDTVHPTTRLKTRGICSLLSPRELRPGIVPVDLVLRTGASGSVNEVARAYNRTSWEQAFAPDWEITSFKLTDRGGVQISLKAVPAHNMIANSKAIDVNSLVVNLDVSVRTLDPGDDAQIFSEIPVGTQTVDAKKAVFMIESEAQFDRFVGSSGERQKGQSEAKDIVSVLDVGSCDVRDSAGRALILSPAGTGVGDPAGRTIYNNTEFRDIGVPAFEIVLATREVVQGKYANGRLSADHEKNVVSACTETRYRCPKNREARDYRSFINLTANVNYRARNMYGYRERVRIVPKVELVDSSGSDILSRYNTTSNYTLGTALEYRKHSDGLYYPTTATGGLDLAAPMSLSEGGRRVLATINNAQPLCQSVCSTNQHTSLRPQLKLTTPDLLDSEGKPVEEFMAATMPLHCTMCFAKGCTRVGIETFGPVDEMPPEPLDAQVPECSAQEQGEGNRILPYAQRNIQAPGSGACVAARVVDGRLSFVSRNCNDSLPAMCFAFGQYTLARDLASKNVVSVNHAAAQAACRAMGRESINPAQLREAIVQGGSSPDSLAAIPVSGGRHNILNLSKVGTFIAPQTPEEQGRAAADLKNRFPAAQISADFWVALRKDTAGLVADIPRAALSNAADEQHMIYYTAAGVLTHRVLNTTPYSYVRAPASSSNQAHALFNHAKYRGVVPVDRVQENPMEFLCMRRSDRSFFVTSDRANTDFAQGGSACESQGGLFVAPHSPTAWLQALMAVAPHGNFLPFPELTESPHRVWIALGDSHAPALQGEFAKLGLRKNSSEPLSNSLVDRDGSYIEIQRTQKRVEIQKKDEDEKSDSEPEYEWVPNPDVRIKVACYSSQSAEITVRPVEQGCSSGELRLTEEGMKRSVISLIWVLNKSRFDLGALDFIKVD